MSILYFDNNLMDFLSFSVRSSIISAIFKDGDQTHLTDFGNYLKVEDETTISFLPKTKYEKVDDYWNEGRVKMKIGRFVNKILTEFSIANFSITDSTIEKFVNCYKSFFTRDMSKLKIVEGDDIMKFYCEDNYFSINDERMGSLWNSCMRQRNRNKFMRLYSNNSNKVKMLILFSDDNTTIKGRALLWYDVEDHKSDNKYKVMDRIYTYYDHDVEFFKDWAKENGFLYKYEQNSRNTNTFVDKENIIEMELYVKLNISGLNYYPYLDTFRFLKDNVFSNTTNYRHDFILKSSNGSYEEVYYDDNDDNDDNDEIFLDVDNIDSNLFHPTTRSFNITVGRNMFNTTNDSVYFNENGRIYYTPRNEEE